MATSSPAQERQLVPMESMKRRLDSILKSKKKLEGTNAALQPKKRQVAKLTLRTGET